MKPEITVILRIRAKHQTENMEAIRDGFKALGVPVVLQGANVPIKTKHVALWGWRLGKELRDQGYEVMVAEHGYIGDRFKHTSLAWNGLNGYGTFAEYPDDAERFTAHGGEILPWKYNDDAPALLLGQLKDDQSLKGENIESLYNEWVRKSDRPVIYRPHPVMQAKGMAFSIKAEESQGTLREALDKCSYALAFNSNSLVDALMYGVPAVAMDRGSMVHRLCGEGLGHIIRPKREKVLYSLAWKQFTLDEIAKGWPLEHLWRLRLGNP